MVIQAPVTLVLHQAWGDLTSGSNHSSSKRGSMLTQLWQHIVKLISGKSGLSMEWRWWCWFFFFFLQLLLLSWLALLSLDIAYSYYYYHWWWWWWAQRLEFSLWFSQRWTCSDRMWKFCQSRCDQTWLGHFPRSMTFPSWKPLKPRFLSDFPLPFSITGGDIH